MVDGCVVTFTREPVLRERVEEGGCDSHRHGSNARPEYIGVFRVFIGRGKGGGRVNHTANLQHPDVCMYVCVSDEKVDV